MSDTTNTGGDTSVGAGGTQTGAGGGQQSGGTQQTGTQGNGQQGSSGGGQQGSGGQTGTQSSTDQQQTQTQTQGQQGAENGQKAFELPEAYKNAPWASKVKSMDDVYKQLDNLNTAVGKKTVIPDLKTSTPEEREAYYAQTRPKDATAYTIPDDINGFPVTQATKEGVGKIFLDNGISEVQGNAVIKAYNELGKAQISEQFSPDGMKAALQTAFGDQWEGITSATRNTIKGMMSADDQKALDTMPNAYLGVVYRALGNVVKKFGVKETDSAHFGGSGNAGGGDINTQRAGIRAEIAKLGDQPHTIDQANTLRQKLADTYKNDPRIQR